PPQSFEYRSSATTSQIISLNPNSTSILRSHPSCIRVLCPTPAVLRRHNSDALSMKPLEIYDEAPVCKRFCAVLKTSPQLIPVVRRLRASLEPEVLRQLSPVEFLNLRTLVFHRGHGGDASDESIALASHLLALPFLRRVGLIFIRFGTLHDLGRLFQGCNPSLDSVILDQAVDLDISANPHRTNSVPPKRIRIKTLRFAPVYYGPYITQSIIALLERARDFIRRLTVEACT
ncbi:hypothetical protein B0H17DRAFT_1088117, partial [Mycena rosella]